jgi:hypothetical protein
MMSFQISNVQSGAPSPPLLRSTGGGSAFIRHYAACVGTLLLLVGCTSHSTATQSLVQSPVYAVPAKQLVGEVQRIVESPPVSLAVEDKGDGTLLTGWQEPFRGDFHIARFWHERTRYHITIAPDFNDPVNRSRIQITDETEERPDESGPNVDAHTWHPAPRNHRPERAEALLHQIQTKLVVPVSIGLPGR